MPIPNFEVLIHGIGLKVLSSSPLLLDPVRRFLRYFPPLSDQGVRQIEIQLFAMSSRESLPSFIFSQTSKVSSQGGLTRGDAKRTEWHCDVYVESDILIADFHEQGLIRIDFFTGPGSGVSY